MLVAAFSSCSGAEINQLQLACQGGVSGMDVSSMSLSQLVQECAKKGREQRNLLHGLTMSVRDAFVLGTQLHADHIALRGFRILSVTC
jgi:hypothetical protein